MSSSRVPDKNFRAGSTGLLLLWLWTAAPGSLAAQTPDDKFARARQTMVERDLAARGIKNKKVLDAMRAVPRHHFVVPNDVAAAYEDRPLAIGEGQTISQPFIVALMTELLEIQGDEKVLEIGTGSGYQAAVLSLLVKEVYTIEILPPLAERAKQTLARLGHNNVQIKTGDGFFGWEEKGPFDAVLLTAAAEKIPEPLWRQLREDGRLVMPMGKEGRTQRLVRVKKVAGQQRIEKITDVAFVPMTGEVRKEIR